MMTREICKACHRPVAVGFDVPHEVWAAVAPAGLNVLCLGCFTTLADEALVEWDKAIEFHPVSLATHLGLKGGAK